MDRRIGGVPVLRARRAELHRRGRRAPAAQRARRGRRGAGGRVVEAVRPVVGRSGVAVRRGPGDPRGRRADADRARADRLAAGVSGAARSAVPDRDQADPGHAGHRRPPRGVAGSADGRARGPTARSMRAGRIRGKALPVEHGRPDEIGELATAFNEAARDDRRSRCQERRVHRGSRPPAQEPRRRRARRRRGARRGSVDRRRTRPPIVHRPDRQLAPPRRAGHPVPRARPRGGGPVGRRADDGRPARARGRDRRGRRRADGGPNVDVTGAPAIVRGVAERRESVLRNLVDNAVSFAGPEGRVAVDVRIVGGDAVVRVDDSGPASRRRTFRACSTDFSRAAPMERAPGSVSHWCARSPRPTGGGSRCVRALARGRRSR